MRKTLLFSLILVGATVVLVVYFTLLIDWVDRYFVDMHRPNQLKGVLESAALLVYVYAGIKFFNRHVGSMR
ncbi:hypothetical protein SAMN06269250_0471 [Spirosoma fluviale]|uniref:Uncharacterized protein n=1 Tax=Spirosoma fluviale TaxID=1597977 RepID=A0A286F5S4_9BACT|nr:hypothetical protein SAMN06269250_0471 [Spirosoma fluviale]